MAKLNALPAQNIISGFKGTLDFYQWLGIKVCRAWPRLQKETRSPAVVAQWRPFAEASTLWNTLSPEVQAAYETMASGSTMTGRDMSIKMYLNAKSILPY
jgi:hypothetical protein